MKTRNPKYTETGAVEVEIEHPDFGWIPFSYNDPEETALAAEVAAALDPNMIAPFVGPDVETRKAEALRAVDTAHATYLSLLIEHATPEERDTWLVKAEAAQAYLDGTASAAQTALIETEAAGGGRTPDELAQKIIVKDIAFHGHIGQAGALRASGRAALKATATHDALQAALEAFYAEVHAAVDALGGGQS
ncbi:hypothetical protein [uncultured Ruegeria sp.]|uniref:hypothetical protein n=1 Tax=uncultured Ruegeria sp. TaxID=259304 RepID=UPI00263A299E|nr:hypothetical protein [uncultured Ruegeria sp.]